MYMYALTGSLSACAGLYINIALQANFPTLSARLHVQIVLPTPTPRPQVPATQVACAILAILVQMEGVVWRAVWVLSRMRAAVLSASGALQASSHKLKPWLTAKSAGCVLLASTQLRTLPIVQLALRIHIRLKAPVTVLAMWAILELMAVCV